MEQRLVKFNHSKHNLFYIGCYDNGARLENSCSVESNYARAKFLHNQMKENGAAIGLQSGFMMALINTNFEGWTHELLEEVYPSGAEAAAAKMALITTSLESNSDLKFVGSERLIVKGINGQGKRPANWSKKFNVNAMNQSKIRQKIDFICTSIVDDIPQDIYKDAYMAIVAPDTHGPRNRNYGSYQVDDLSSLFHFVRNYIGKDLD